MTNQAHFSSDDYFSMPSRSKLQQHDRLASEMPDPIPMKRGNFLNKDAPAYKTGPSIEQPDPIYTYLRKGNTLLAKEYLGSIKGKVQLPYAEDQIPPRILDGWLSAFSSFRRDAWSFYPIVYI